MNNTYKTNLDTPCLIIDKNLLIRNLIEMQKEIISYGKNLRPHIKTHKCSEIAKLQIQHGAMGVCAAKVSEAEILVNSQIKAILITSPIVTDKKIQTLMKCLKTDPTVMVVIDSESNALKLNTALEEINQQLQILIDIDPGVGRTGVTYQNALKLGQFVNELPNLLLKGIQCYAGNLQHIANYEERKHASQKVLAKAAKIVNQFKAAGLICDIFTGSGTGTYSIDCEIGELTEVQPGSYTVMDKEYELIGSKENPKQFTKFKPAMTMLVSVISANHPTHVTVDAGTKALYFDPSTKPEIISHKGLHYDWGGFGDEHGKITADEGVPLPKVGEVLELVVPHCDPTINLFDKFYIIENEKVIEEWPIDMRGKSQ